MTQIVFIIFYTLYALLNILNNKIRSKYFISFLKYLLIILTQDRSSLRNFDWYEL